MIMIVSHLCSRVSLTSDSQNSLYVPYMYSDLIFIVVFGQTKPIRHDCIVLQRHLLFIFRHTALDLEKKFP